ncbi:MAG: CU044_2847 family protein [Caldilineaceae bacterium]
MANLYALLIGVDHYFEYRLPGGLYYPRLGGCVRDINKVYAFLTTRLQLDPANITKLTASLGNRQPQEPESQWPTYTNMVHAFQELTNKAQAGDQIYIQYSGHGGRTTTMFPALKGADAFDEGLVPLDIGKPNDPNARYLRDVELHDLIETLVSKEVRLTVVFDCCHSGGATRDIGGARKRGIGEPDLSPPPTDSAVGALPDLLERWQGTGGAASRALHSQSGWLFETKGYTLLAACRANESAFEFPFDGRENNGALTYWLLDTLTQADPNTTWQMVADRVAAKVHGQFESQTPLIQGEGDYQIFGANRLQSHYAVAVLAVEAARRRVRLNAGEAQGLVVGARFAIYPSAGEIEDEAKRQALVELTEVDAATAWANVVEPEGEITVEVGAQAVMLPSSAVRVQRAVHVAIREATLRQQVEAAIAAESNGFLAVVGADEGADFLVDLNPRRPAELVVQDSGGSNLPSLRPAIGRDDPDALSRLVKRLVHLAQYRNVQTLDMPDGAMAAKLKVEIEGNAVSKPGDLVTFKITNTQQPNPRDPNDPERILNITVLDLASDWSIAQIYPSGAAPSELLNPGETLPIEFEASLPPGQHAITDIVKVFATRATTNFRWLELPSLDEPRPRGQTRSVAMDPLEQLLATVTDEETQTRALRLSASGRKDKGWTVAQVTLRVTEDGEAAAAPDDPTPSTLAATPGDQRPTVTDQGGSSARMEVDPAALDLENPAEFQILVQFPELEASTAEAAARGLDPGKFAAQLEERSRYAIQAAMSTIREMAMQTDLMRKGIPGGSQPRMVKVKFGINMDLKLGAFLAQANTGATMEVELEWARRSDDVLRVLRAETDVDGALFTDADAKKGKE